MKTLRVKEINTFQKAARSIRWRIGLVYPNTYSVGMSGLSIKLLYHLLNQYQNIFTERIFYPIESYIVAKSLETNRTIPQFDILAFTFQFELDYINAIKMLQQANIPVFKKERKQKTPLLIAGGPAVTANPEPLLEVFDYIFLGEFESVSSIFLRAILESKQISISESIKNISGFYDIDDWDITTKPIITSNLDEVNYPTAQVRPIYTRPQKTGGLEGYFLQISRGCPHGCHFCLIGTTFRPHRERSLSLLKHLVQKGTIETQTNHVSLIGSSTADYSDINSFLTYLHANNISFSLPSIRVDTGEEIIGLIKPSGQRSLTIAPEAGSDEIRRRIGKRFTNAQIHTFSNNALNNNISQLKSYFMLGLTKDPINEAKAILNLLNSLIEKNPKMKYTLSLTPLIPKRGTKFSKQCMDYPSIIDGFNYLKKNIDHKVPLKPFPIRWAVVQAILSMGGRELTPIMIEVAKKDGSFQAWKKTLKMDPLDFYVKNYCN
jgi:radical SAM superfamily enzyme YgiQ (UPF0313 family)